MWKYIITFLFLFNSCANAITIERYHQNLIITGSIVAGDQFLLQEVLKEKNITTLELNSDGGDIEIAGKLGRIIRSNNLNTFVDGKKDGCLSSCTALFSAGIKRMYINSKYRYNSDRLTGLGYHHATENGKDSPAGNGDMYNLYVEFGTPNVYKFLLKATHDGMHIITEKEAKETEIINVLTKEIK